VVGEQEFDNVLAGFEHVRVVGEDFHAVGSFGDTGRQEGAGTRHLTHAHAASAFGAEKGMVAEGGDIDADLFSGVQNGGAGRSGDSLAVYSQSNHITHKNLLLGLSRG
jgi:hypothetical protein